ncbi:uncharacterized protein LOC114541877 [Dendronephthya gigantea]|uniref:uncharacterized protein LOC114541877 n=1 Tax=Dendronephthya gigantea TaxID=151771 RepID=UPI00106B1F59|nr:uncharacterized protein LOC114541877 [Dendronephthya gigantea]
MRGSFLYAYHFQFGLRNRYDLEVITYQDIIEFLPEGLNSIYLRYFKRLEDELEAIKHEKLDVFKILEMLAASKGSLPLTFIAQVFGLAPDCRETKDIISKVNETVSCLLYVSDDMLTVFHKSVIDWLLGKGYENHQYTVKFDNGNRSLWLLCEKVFKEIKNSVYSGHRVNLTSNVKYALEHSLKHLEESNMEVGIFWSVDVAILCYMLLVNPVVIGDYLTFWSRILRSPHIKNEELRARISWHVIELGILRDHSRLLIMPLLFTVCFKQPVKSWHEISRSYLEAVLTHSQQGYFSEDEKKIAKSLLSNHSRFLELNSCEVPVLPRAVWRPSYDAFNKDIAAVALSNDKERVAVGTRSSIHVMSVPTLVELIEYSTQLRRVSCCTFSHDDSLILFGKLETAFSIAENKEVLFFPGNEETFLSCDFSPNGKRMVTSDGSKTIKLWDVSKQRLLSSLCAEFSVDWCTFSINGLFIIGNSESLSSKSIASYSFCVWNAITLKRSDQRIISNMHRKEQSVLTESRRKCERCFQQGFQKLNSKQLSLRYQFGSKFVTLCPWICKDEKCISPQQEYSDFSVIESILLTAFAAWNDIRAIHLSLNDTFLKLTDVKDNLWLYTDTEKLIVLKTLTPTQTSCPLSHSTVVYSSSFSPDGSRLASCNSDGYINVWNVYTSQVQQRFKINQYGSRFLCWWSKNFLFVISGFNGIPNLTRYPVDHNVDILFTYSKEMPLSHLKAELDGLTSILDFSEGFLSFVCCRNAPINVLNVGRNDGPVMVNLPGIEPKMDVKISPGGAFIFGGNKTNHYIWRRNSEKSDLYEVFFSRDAITSKYGHRISCSFTGSPLLDLLLVKYLIHSMQNDMKCLLPSFTADILSHAPIRAVQCDFFEKPSGSHHPALRHSKHAI